MVSSLGPAWFLEVDVIFNIIFLLVSAIVTLLGFQAYRFFKDERHRLHSTGFLLLCASYLLLTLSNLFVMLELREVHTSLRDFLQIMNVNYIGWLLFSLFFLAGLTFLLIVYLQIKDKAVRLLLFTLVLFSVLLSHRVRSAFYLLLAVLLLFIIWKLSQNYRAKRTTPALLVLLGFTMLFVGEFLLSILFLGPILYVFAGVVTLVGYLCILASLVVR